MTSKASSVLDKGKSLLRRRAVPVVSRKPATKFQECVQENPESAVQADVPSLENKICVPDLAENDVKRVEPTESSSAIEVKPIPPVLAVDLIKSETVIHEVNPRRQALKKRCLPNVRINKNAVEKKPLPENVSVSPSPSITEPAIDAKKQSEHVVKPAPCIDIKEEKPILQKRTKPRVRPSTNFKVTSSGGITGHAIKDSLNICSVTTSNLTKVDKTKKSFPEDTSKQTTVRLLELSLNSWAPVPDVHNVQYNAPGNTNCICVGSISVFNARKGLKCAFFDLQDDIQPPKPLKNWVHVDLNKVKLFDLGVDCERNKVINNNDSKVKNNQVVELEDKCKNDLASVNKKVDCVSEKKDAVSNNVKKGAENEEDVTKSKEKVSRKRRAPCEASAVTSNEENSPPPADKYSFKNNPKKRRTGSFHDICLQFKKKWKKEDVDESALLLKEFIAYTPRSEPMNTTTTKECQSGIVEEDCKVDESASSGPRVIIKDGQIIVDPSTIRIKQTVRTDPVPLPAKKRQSTALEIWELSETIQFYHVIWKYGIDLSLILSEFPGKTRVQIKKKMNYEQRHNGKLIEYVSSGQCVDFKEVMRELIIINHKKQSNKDSYNDYSSIGSSRRRLNRKSAKKKAAEKHKKIEILKKLFQDDLSDKEDSDCGRETQTKNDTTPVISIDKKISRPQRSCIKPPIIDSETEPVQVDYPNIIKVSTNVSYSNMNIKGSLLYNNSNNSTDPVDFNITISHS